MSHVIHVSLKHPNSVDGLVDILQLSPDFVNWLRSYYSLEQSREIHDCIRRMIALVCGVEAKSRTGYKTLLSAENGKTEVARAILSYLQSKGVKLLIIFDGIDNIDYYDGEKQVNDFLTRLRSEFNLFNEKRAFFDAKILVVLRPETLEFLRGAAQTYDHPIIFKIKGSSLKDIACIKAGKAMSLDVARYREERTKAYERVDADEGLRKIGITSQQVEKGFLDSCEELISELDKELGSMAGPALGMKIDPNVAIFRENMRLLISSLLYFHQYRMLFEIKMSLKHRNYLVFESLTLHGKLFFDSKGPFSAERPFPNLMYYERYGTSPIWHGMCGIRVLQLLQELGPSCEDDLLLPLCELLAFDHEIGHEFFRRYLDDGLIEIAGFGAARIMYRITSKGSYALTIFTRKLDMLYYHGLDAPLTYEVLRRSALVTAHRLFWQLYTESAVRVVLTVIRHIESECRREADLANQYAGSTARLKIIADRLRAVPPLDFSTILDHAKNMIQALDPPVRREGFVDDLKDIATGKDGL
jgi:hypothetical protein